MAKGNAATGAAAMAETDRDRPARPTGDSGRKTSGTAVDSVDVRAMAMYVLYIMKRTQIYLDADQDRGLAARARAAGTTKSAVIREAVEAYLSSGDDSAARLAAFRDALDAVERSPIDLTDGRAYVEGVRAEDERRAAEIERRRG